MSNVADDVKWDLNVGEDESRNVEWNVFWWLLTVRMFVED